MSEVRKSLYDLVASSREDAWIETQPTIEAGCFMLVASSREDAWIETSQFAKTHDDLCRVLPRGRVD